MTKKDQPPGAAAVADSGAVIDNFSGEHHVVVAQNTPLFTRCFLAKPLSVVHAEESEGVLERSLGFWDLFALGFGGTVGRCGEALHRIVRKPCLSACIHTTSRGQNL